MARKNHKTTGVPEYKDKNTTRPIMDLRMEVIGSLSTSRYVRLHLEVHDRLRDAAHRRRVHMMDIASVAVAEWLERNERGQAA